MRRLGKFKKAEEDQSEQMSLQITSMADIFTIILVFLLKSISSGMASVTPSQGMVLPSISTPSKKSVANGLKLEIFSNAILIDQKPVISFSNFALPKETNGVSDQIVKSLMLARGGQSAESHLLVLADEKTPYEIIKLVTSSAGQAGYVDLQLMVIERQ